jgi:hypothetical protein
VKNNCDELELYDLVKIRRIERHPENGKPSFDVELTAKGQEVTRKIIKKD